MLVVLFGCSAAYLAERKKEKKIRKESDDNKLDTLYLLRLNHNHMLGILHF